MSVAFQSWEAASVPAVGYNVETQGNHCGVEGPRYRIHSQHNTLIRGLSDLSLYVPPHADSVSFEDNIGHRQPACPSKENASFVLPPRLASCSALVDDSSTDTEEQDSSTSVVKLSDDNRRFGKSSGIPDSSRKLDAVSEDRPWHIRPMKEALEANTISSSSISSTEGESFHFSVSASQDNDETEVQSSFEGNLDCSGSPEASIPAKKGLSQFYSGKSQSFSCLADVISVQDLAKPENPYNRKRKNLQSGSCNLDRPRLPPMRNGAVGISKKSHHNSKYTLALALAMSTNKGSLGTHEQDFTSSVGVARSNSKAAPLRSHSLSDLQGAGCRFSPQ